MTLSITALPIAALRPLLLCWLVLFGSLADAATQLQLQVLTLHNRPAADLLEQLQLLYPPDQATISADGQRLLVRAEAAITHEIEQLVRTLDVAVPQLRIHVRSLQGQSAQSQGGGLSASNRQIGLHAQQRVTSTQGQREQSLLVQNGQSAQISDGQIRLVPIGIAGGYHPSVISQPVNLERGVVLKPRIISTEQVELQITAFDETPIDGQNNQFNTSALITVQRVSPGVWTRIGSTQVTQQQSRNAILHSTQSQASRQQGYEVLIELVDP